MLIALLLFSFAAFGMPCGPHEVYVRQHQIDAYKKKDGTYVRTHIRKAHCRELRKLNYFKNSTNKELKGIQTVIKKWKPDEKKVLEQHLDRMPAWLKKYKFSEILRGIVGGNAKNPASTIPLPKILVIFDNFFTRPNKIEILIHEVAHLAILDLTEKELIGFVKSSGWIIDRKKGIKRPPNVLILPDSSDSVSEDFANHVEIYYSNPEGLKKLNPKSFSFIELIIKKRERQ